ncbi:MAG TPA: molybdopterin molybdenumtransferase MoeA, partial [Planctomycetota bacterium]
MLTPAEALAQVLASLPGPLASERVPLAEAAGRTLAEPVRSDVDLPPFEKSMMDGFALAAASLPAGGGRLRVVGEARAGAPFAGTVAPGTCVEIFTGAELPAGCDAVEMVERTRREGRSIRFEAPVKAGQHVSHRAEILRVDQTVYEPRRRLSSADLSVLATIG